MIQLRCVLETLERTGRACRSITHSHLIEIVLDHFFYRAADILSFFNQIVNIPICLFSLPGYCLSRPRNNGR